jgi:hypothetical protein
MADPDFSLEEIFTEPNPPTTNRHRRQKSFGALMK